MIKSTAQKILHGDGKWSADYQEVRKLQDAGFLREVRFQTCVANLVLVINVNDKWRMSVNFQNLTKSCPKDTFPLNRIDQSVNTTYDH